MNVHWQRDGREMPFARHNYQPNQIQRLMRMGQHANHHHANGQLHGDLPPLALLRRVQRDGGPREVRSERVTVEGDIIRLVWKNQSLHLTLGC